MLGKPKRKPRNPEGPLLGRLFTCLHVDMLTGTRVNPNAGAALWSRLGAPLRWVWRGSR